MRLNASSVIRKNNGQAALQEKRDRLRIALPRLTPFP